MTNVAVMYSLLMVNYTHPVGSFDVAIGGAFSPVRLVHVKQLDCNTELGSVLPLRDMHSTGNVNMLYMECCVICRLLDLYRVTVS